MCCITALEESSADQRRPLQPPLHLEWRGCSEPWLAAAEPPQQALAGRSWLAMAGFQSKKCGENTKNQDHKGPMRSPRLSLAKLIT